MLILLWLFFYKIFYFFWKQAYIVRSTMVWIMTKNLNFTFVHKLLIDGVIVTRLKLPSIFLSSSFSVQPISWLWIEAEEEDDGSFGDRWCRWNFPANFVITTMIRRNFKNLGKNWKNVGSWTKATMAPGISTQRIFAQQAWLSSCRHHLNGSPY